MKQSTQQPTPQSALIVGSSGYVSQGAKFVLTSRHGVQVSGEVDRVDGGAPESSVGVSQVSGVDGGVDLGQELDGAKGVWSVGSTSVPVEMSAVKRHDVTPRVAHVDVPTVLVASFPKVREDVPRVPTSANGVDAPVVERGNG